ncbi:hypothetical protein MTO96_030116 [Rhipicephalus appendiculatus]
MDYAKSRFQGLPEPKQFEELFKQKPCRNGHVVNDAKSRWESLTSPSSTAEQLWPNSVESSRSAPVAIPGSNSNHDLQAPDLDSPLSTSPRRLNSPEALFLEASSPPSIPHPRLTSSQKQHIRERSLSPTERVHMHVPVRPFLTKGSVAERVLLFERCPERAGLERTPAPAKVSKQTVYNAWKQHHGAGDAHSGSQLARRKRQRTAEERVLAAAELLSSRARARDKRRVHSGSDRQREQLAKAAGATHNHRADAKDACIVKCSEERQFQALQTALSILYGPSALPLEVQD